MFSLTTLASASLILGFLCLLYVAISALVAPLRAIPGPFLARLTRFWYLQEIYRGHFERTDVDLHRKYGSIESTISILKSNNIVREHRTDSAKRIQYR